MSIPANEPVTPAMLENLRKKLGLSVTDFCWVFCLSLPAWSKMKKYDPDNGIYSLHEKVSDPAVALYARLLDRQPELCPLPPQISAREMYDVLLRIRENFTKKELAVMIGREASSGYRWIEQTGKMPPILQRIGRTLVDNLKDALTDRKPTRAEEILQDWLGIVEEEARARSIGNVMAVGNWNREPVAPAKPIEEKIAEKARSRGRPRAQQKRDKELKAAADKA